MNFVESLNVVDTFSDDDTNSDEDDTRMSAMVVSSVNQIEVQANLEYEKRFINSAHYSRISHAICDSGADSCVVEKIAKIESVTIIAANIVAYDPQTNKSFNLPILTALWETVSAENAPILL